VCSLFGFTDKLISFSCRLVLEPLQQTNKCLSGLVVQDDLEKNMLN